MAEEKLIGEITHYFGHIGVGIILLNDELRVGDKIRIKGVSSEFEQTVDSMQVDHKEITMAKAGDEVGLKMGQKVRDGEQVFKI